MNAINGSFVCVSTCLFAFDPPNRYSTERIPSSKLKSRAPTSQKKARTRPKPKTRVIEEPVLLPARTNARPRRPTRRSSAASRSDPFRPTFSTCKFSTVYILQGRCILKKILEFADMYLLLFLSILKPSGAKENSRKPRR